MQEKDILYENGKHWVAQATFGSKSTGKSEGFAVFRNNSTHAVRVASIGYSGDDGLARAKAEADRRELKESK